jgi:hypothetical protein
MGNGAFIRSAGILAATVLLAAATTSVTENARAGPTTDVTVRQQVERPPQVQPQPTPRQERLQRAWLLTVDRARVQHKKIEQWQKRVDAPKAKNGKKIVEHTSKARKATRLSSAAALWTLGK